MNLFNKCSIASVAVSLLLFGLNGIVSGYFELSALIGTLFLRLCSYNWLRRMRYCYSS